MQLAVIKRNSHAFQSYFYGYDAFGNALGNSIVRAPQSNGTTTKNEQSGGGDRDSRSGGQSVGTTQGNNSSTGATNLNQEGSLDRWNRLQASGELENLSDAEYYDLALAANANEAFLYGPQVPSTYDPSVGVQIARNGVASANYYQQQRQLLDGDNVSLRVQNIVANEGRNTIRDASYISQYKSSDAIGPLAPSIESPTTPGPWIDGYVFSDGSQETFYADRQHYTKLSTGIGLLDITSDSLFAALNAGWGATPNIGRKPNIMWFDPKLISALDYSFAAPAFDTIGKGAAFATPFVSALNGVNETLLNPDGYDNFDVARETGKFVTDSLAAATALSKFARFTPVGIAYTAVDIGVQNFVPDYTIQYGSNAGDIANGWSGLMHRSTDYEAYKIQNGLIYDRSTR